MARARRHGHGKIPRGSARRRCDMQLASAAWPRGQHAALWQAEETRQHGMRILLGRDLAALQITARATHAGQQFRRRRIASRAGRDPRDLSRRSDAFRRDSGGCRNIAPASKRGSARRLLEPPGAGGVALAAARGPSNTGARRLWLALDCPGPRQKLAAIGRVACRNAASPPQFARRPGVARAFLHGGVTPRTRRLLMRLLWCQRRPGSAPTSGRPAGGRPAGASGGVCDLFVARGDGATLPACARDDERL